MRMPSEVVLILRLPRKCRFSQTWQRKQSKCAAHDALGSPGPTYIFILLDAFHDPGRQRRVSDREVRGERHGDLSLEELRNSGVIWVGAEEVARDHGKGEVVLAVQRRKLLEGGFELAIKAAQYDAVEQ